MLCKRLVILDGYSLLFRAFYGTRYLSTTDGRPTNALFGFLNMMLALFGSETTRPDVIVVALDAPGKTFRHADFAEYKGTRRETPPELISQLEFSRELLAHLNIPSLELVGYEADDIVGTLSRKAKDHDCQTIIVTGDHDSLQLVDDMVHVLMPQNGPYPPKLYTPVEVRERYSLEPDQIRDYKALAGDSSDNIPGVPGIGEKSAVKLLQVFGNVEAIHENLDRVEEKFRKKIVPAVDSMLLSKKLATIDRDVPVEFDFAPYHLTHEDYERAKKGLLDLEFKSQAKRLDVLLAPYFADGVGLSSTPIEVVGEALEVKEIAVPADLAAWVGAAPFALLPTGGKPQRNLFGDNGHTEWVLAKGMEACTISDDQAGMLAGRLPQQLVGHDVKPLFQRLPEGTPGPLMDAVIGGYVLQSGRSTYDLPSLISGYLEGTQAETPMAQAAALLLLNQEMTERIEKEGQTRVLREVELPLIPILAAMENKGITVSASLLGDFSKSLEVTIEQSKTLIHELAGCEFNIGSPKQLGEILFEKMGLPGGKKTKTGWATGVEILGEMAPTVPIAAEIITYRELTKLKSTYADSLPKMIGVDGRIHTTFNQAVAATGRLSSIDPNLQNIPVRTELGRQIRKAFLAAEGCSLLSLDYSQIELRVLAHMCQDVNLVDAFNKREDVHTVTASLMFGVAEDSVTKEQRRLAKMLNYAVLYGVTGFGLANQLGAGFSAGDASALIKQYNERFPMVKAFTDAIVDDARSKGFTSTLIGRRRYFPDIHAANRQLRSYAERQAMNAPIQGTAADLIKLAMIEVDKKRGSTSLKMLLQVHDELVFEGPAVTQEDVEGIRSVMENSLPMSVPVEVDAKAGRNWLEMTPMPAVRA